MLEPVADVGALQGVWRDVPMTHNSVKDLLHVLRSPEPASAFKQNIDAQLTEQLAARRRKKTVSIAEPEGVSAASEDAPTAERPMPQSTPAVIDGTRHAVTLPCLTPLNLSPRRVF